MAATVAEVYEFEVGQRQLVRRFLWAAAGLGAVRAKGFLTLPLTLWVLGPEGYGRLATALALAGLVAPVALLNIPDGAGRLIVSAPSPQLAAARLAAVRRLCAGVSATLAAVAIGAAAAGLGLAAWAGLVAAGLVAFKGGSVHLEYFQRTSRLVRFQVAAEYGSVAAGLSLALWLGADGMLAATAAVLCLTGLAARRTLRAGQDGGGARAFWRPALALSLPLLPVALAQWALYSLDTLLLFRLEGARPAGAFSAAYSLAAVALLLPLGVNAVWAPTAQRLLSRSARELAQALKRIALLLVPVSLAVVLLAVAAGPIVGRFLDDPAYRVVPAVLPWLAAAFAALAFAKLLEGVVYALGRPLPIMAASVAGAALNLGLALVLIPGGGILGAAYATAGGYGLTALALAPFAARGLRGSVA